MTPTIDEIQEFYNFHNPKDQEANKPDLVYPLTQHQFEQLKSEVSALEAENERLKAEVAELRRQLAETQARFNKVNKMWGEEVDESELPDFLKEDE